MIASSIGKIFLKEYNKRKGSSYSAQEFFEKVYHPLFFDHEKYMQWVVNSPFVQGIRKGKSPTAKERREKLINLKEKMLESMADASIAIGYPSLDVMSTTSGQLTDLDLPLENEDFYASWIGGGLGVGVKGGLSIYFDEPDILWKIFEGWHIYRNLLQELDQLRGNQIESWNGHWLAHANSYDYTPDQIFAPVESVTTGKYKGMMEIPTKRWTEILIAIGQQYQNRSLLNGYVFSLGQMNTTVGFIPFYLPQIRKPIQFYIELFGKSEYLNNADRINSLFGSALGFLTACQMGVIGVRAMEPKDMKKFIGDGRNKGKTPNFFNADEEAQISFKTYQTWLLAMLDNKQLWDEAEMAAKAYLQYEAEDKRNSTKHMRNVEAVLESTGKKKFIENNLPIIASGGESNEDVEQLVKSVNSMPEDSFRYYLTLIRFRYTFIKHQKTTEL